MVAGRETKLPPTGGLRSSAWRRLCKRILTMIVRDEEANISHCLESVRGLFDEIVVLDTGSKDRTIEIARSFGARVFDFVWVDDFAAGRNAALARARGDYAFWLDADDVIEPSERAKLQGLLGGLAAAGKTAPLSVAALAMPGRMARAEIPSSIISGCSR